MLQHFGDCPDPVPVGMRAEPIVEAGALKAIAMRHFDRIDLGPVHVRQGPQGVDLRAVPGRILVEVPGFGETIAQALGQPVIVENKPGAGGKSIAEQAIEAVESGDVKFVPENWVNTYNQWMNNIQDWCISRQLWWGHQIPAWYDEDGNVYVARNEQDALQQSGGKPVKRDDDVLDTWFSSALWPFSTMGWPNQTPELAKYYPITSHTHQLSYRIFNLCWANINQ